MAFKKNLPLAALVLFFAGIGAVVLLLQPPPEDRFRQAVLAHARSLGAVEEPAVDGAVADILLPGSPPRVVYLLFEQVDGEWKVAKDLGKDFLDFAAREETERALLDRLGRTIFDRTRVAPRFDTSTLKKEVTITRDRSGLAGIISVTFQYEPGERGRQGRYIETYRFRGEGWEVQGMGSLLDRGPSRR